MNQSVGPLREAELGRADRIFRLAFGTFVGLPDPMTFAGDTDYVHTRWRADPEAAFAATRDGILVGSNFAARWGSVGIFGPLSVHPDEWGRGFAQALLERTMALFDRSGIGHRGLFTFSSSPKHVALYQRFDYWPRFLTAILGRAVGVVPGRAAGGERPGSTRLRFSTLAADARERALADARAVTGEIFDGLDLALEIRAVAAQHLGDTILLVDDSGRPAALAVCHVGAGSEAGSGATYVKFGAARPGPAAAENFAELNAACDALAADSGTARLVAGVNLGCDEAYRALLAAGFRVDMLGVAMQRGRDPGYHRPGVFAIDDWR